MIIISLTITDSGDSLYDKYTITENGKKVLISDLINHIGEVIKYNENNFSELCILNNIVNLVMFRNNHYYSSPLIARLDLTVINSNLPISIYISDKNIEVDNLVG